jgi:hypothetical protein
MQIDGNVPWQEVNFELLNQDMNYQKNYTTWNYYFTW